MSVLLVSYDLNNEVKRPNITKRIKDNFNWARLSESSYAIETSLTPEKVLEFLRPMIDNDDNIYIINLKRPYSGFGPPDVNQWLASKLSY